MAKTHKRLAENGTQIASVAKSGGGPGPFPPPPPPRVSRKVLYEKSLGECCSACYYDVQEGPEKMCRTCEYSSSSTSSLLVLSVPGRSGSARAITRNAPTQLLLTLNSRPMLSSG